ncbi:hypothetical protein [Aquimarina rhabdastrellae]
MPFKLIPIILFTAIAYLLYKDNSAKLFKSHGFETTNVYISSHEIKEVINSTNNSALKKQLKRILVLRKLMFLLVYLLFFSVLSIAYLSR